MSSDLSVKINKPVSSHALIEAATAILEKLTLQSNVSELTICQLREGLRHPATKADDLKADNKVFLIKIKNHPEEIALVLNKINLATQDSLNNSEFWAGIVVGAMRTPLEFVLAASVAIAFAIETCSNIIDDGLIWSSIHELKPEKLLQILKINQKMSDFQQAVEKIYNSMPLGETEIQKNI